MRRPYLERLECLKCSEPAESYARPGHCLHDTCNGPMVIRRYAPAADLEILARDLKQIAEGEIPGEPDPVANFPTTGTMLWAQGWLLSLTEIGVHPVPEPASR